MPNLRLVLQDGAGNLGSFMVGRLGGLSVGVPDVNNGVMVRPGSTGSCTSLPPISKVNFFIISVGFHVNAKEKLLKRLFSSHNRL